nr:MAG TPA: hypothetical protein [Caudoviricetes sp.]
MSVHIHCLSHSWYLILNTLNYYFLFQKAFPAEIFRHYHAYHEVFVLIIVPLDCTSFSHSIPAYSKLLSISNWLSNRLVRLEVLCN